MPSVLDWLTELVPTLPTFVCLCAGPSLFAEARTRGHWPAEAGWLNSYRSDEIPLIVQRTSCAIARGKLARIRAFSSFRGKLHRDNHTPD